jgi:hypothetical protein
MEVHHHPEVEKKRLKDYLLEGLMIFLAVTLGFFAEGLHEKINNKEKEREYIGSLINNLQQDTLNLKSAIADNQKKLRGLDSLLSLSLKNLADPVNKKILYRFSLGSISFYRNFTSNDATMLQLKNSGGLQYIKHRHIADSIAEYDLDMRTIYASETPYAKAINDATDALSELTIFKLSMDTAYFKNGQYLNKDLPLMTGDPHKIEMFFNKVYLEHGWTKNYINNLQENLPYTIRLLALLKNEYGFDK